MVITCIGLDEDNKSNNSSSNDSKKSDEVEFTLSNLVKQVLNESQNRHLTAGFSISSQSKTFTGQMYVYNNQIQRLGRELSAIGLSTESSFLSLSNKRSIILTKLIDKYRDEYRTKGLATHIIKDLSDANDHPLLKVTVASGVFMMLRILKDAAKINPELCMDTLLFLKSQLNIIDPCELETTKKLPIPGISEKAFDSIHLALETIAMDDTHDILIRKTCLELLLSISVTRGTLNTLMTVIYLILFKFKSNERISCRNNLVRLRKMRRESTLDLPSNKNQINKSSISQGIGENTCFGSDGSFIYTHSSKGITKIGTGINNTSPGFVEAKIKGYRGQEKASIVVIGNKIYYRSANLAPASLIILSVDNLQEIGHVLRNGKGTYKSKILNDERVRFGYDDEDKIKLLQQQIELVDEKKDTPNNDNNDNGLDPDKIKGQLRTIHKRMLELEELGLDEDEEYEEMDDKYIQLFNLLPKDQQNDEAIFGKDKSQVTTNDKDSSDKKAETDEEKKKEEEKKQKQTISNFSPIISDGRFLFSVIPRKPDKNDENSSLDSMLKDNNDTSNNSNNNETNNETKDDAKEPDTGNEIIDDIDEYETLEIGGMPLPPANLIRRQSSVGDIFAVEDEDKKNDVTKSDETKKDTKDDKKDNIVKEVYIDINAFDPDNELEPCHQVTLKRPSIKGDEYCLNFILSEDMKKRRLDKHKDDLNYQRKGNSISHNDSYLYIGNPDHLNFGGSLTMEVWCKWDKETPRNVSQTLFRHGSSSYHTYWYISSYSMYCGCYTPFGSSSGYCSFSSPIYNKWNHFACTYNNGDHIWRMYFNGNLVTTNPSPQNPQCCPQKAPDPNDPASAWRIGSDPSRPFWGKMCDVRIWNEARTSDEIKNSMNSTSPTQLINHSGLMCWYPLTDGLGLSCMDLSKYKHSATCIDCQWNAEERPYALKLSKDLLNSNPVIIKKSDNDTNNDDSNDSNTPNKKKNQENNILMNYQTFEPNICENATFCTNGEVLIVSYPKGKFRNNSLITTGVAQKFNMMTGLLIDEVQYDYFDEIVGLAFNKGGSTIWLYNKEKDNTDATLHSMSPPGNISKWREDRMQDEQLIDDLKPTARGLLEFYPLQDVDFKLTKEQIKQLKLKEQNKMDLTAIMNSVTTNGTVGNSNGNNLLNNIVTPYKEPSPSPQPFSTDDEIKNDNNNDNNNDEDTLLKPQTDEVDAIFALVNLIVKLDDDCETLNSVDSTEPPPYAFSIPFGVDLTSKNFLTLLECAENLSNEFYSNKPDETPIIEEKSIESTPTTNKKQKIPPTIEEIRLMTLLVVIRLLKTNILHLTTWNVDSNSVGFNDMKKDKFGRILNKKTIRERYVTLLNKLVFDRPTRKASKRIEDLIHSEVAECLSIGLSVFYQDPIARIAILTDHVKACLSTKSPNQLRLLLASRYFNSLSAPHNLIGLVPALINLFKKSTDKNENIERKLKNTMYERSMLLHFVLQLVYNNAKRELNNYISNPNGYNNTNNTKTDDDDSDDNSSLITTLRNFLAKMEISIFSVELSKSDPKTYIQFALPYSFKLIDLCSDLIEYLNNETKLKNLKVYHKSVLVKIFRLNIGELLTPLLSAMWNIDITPKLSAKILPHIHRLLMAFDEFMIDLPEVKQTENDFIKGKYERLLVHKSAVCESSHPIGYGQQEKSAKIPGAKTLKLVIDAQSFSRSAPGASLTLYRNKGQRDPIPGATFVSVPDKPVIVYGDAIYATYNSGYQSNAYGFKIYVTATIEEISLEIPFILDISKGLSLLASKCVGEFIQALPDKIVQVKRPSMKWLENELFSQGMEYTKDIEDKARKKIRNLPYNLKCKTSSIPVANEFDRRDAPLNIEYIKLATNIAPLLINVRYMKFPIPNDVKNNVDQAVIFVFAVLIKHNLLTAVAQEFYLMTKDELTMPKVKDIPDSLVRIWKTAQKLRSWLTQKYQQKYSEKQQELMRKLKEEEAKKAAKKKKNVKKDKKKSRRQRGNDLPPQNRPDFGGNNNGNNNNGNNNNGGSNVPEAYRNLPGGGLGGNSNAPSQPGPIPALEEPEIDPIAGPPTTNDEHKSNNNNGNNNGNNNNEMGGLIAELEMESKLDEMKDEQKDGPKKDGKKGKKKDGKKGKKGNQNEQKTPEQLKKEQYMNKNKPKKKQSPEELKKIQYLKSMGKYTGDDESKSNGKKDKKKDGKKGKKDGKKGKPKGGNMPDEIKEITNENDPPKKPIKTIEPDAQESKTGDDDAKKDDSKEEEKVQKEFKIDKAKLYKEIIDEIEKRCNFLLSVIPVVHTDGGTETDTGKTKKTKANVTESKDDTGGGVAALKAWRAQGATVLLKNATEQQRYGLIWKLVLQFLDEKQIDMKQMRQKIEQDKTRARMRAFGFRCLKVLFDSSNFSIVKRELLHFLVPSLHKSHNESFSGSLPGIFSGLTPIGYGLTNNLLSSLKFLYSGLITSLQTPKQSGTHLLQTIIFSFTIKFSRTEFDMFIQLGIFDALKNLLKNINNEPTPKAITTPTNETKTDEIKDKSKEEIKDDDDSKTNDDIDTGYQTAAWSLLEILTTVTKSFDIQKKDKHLEAYLDSVYNILLDQIDLISNQKQKIIESFRSHLPPSARIILDAQIKMEKKSATESVSQKVSSTNTFGIQMASEQENDDDEDIAVETDKQEAFNVRVLNLIESLCDETSAATVTNKKLDAVYLFSQEKTIKALLNILWKRSPRSRVVTIRILKHILISNYSPSPNDLDKYITGNNDANTNGSVFITKLLNDIGSSLLSPLIALYFDGKYNEPKTDRELFDFLNGLNLPLLFAKDMVLVCSEIVMFLRYLVKSNNQCQWKKVICDTLNKALTNYSPTVKKVFDPAGCKLNDIMNNELFEIFGALSVIGGYIDTIRVGSKVYYRPEGIFAIVTSRNLGNGKVSLIRQIEGSVIQKSSLEEIVPIGDVVFDSNDYSMDFMKIIKELYNTLNIDLPLREDLDDAKQEELSESDFKSKYEQDITINDLLKFRLSNISSAVFNSLLYNKKLLNEYLKEFKKDRNNVKLLTKIAFDSCDETCENTSSILLDRNYVIVSECLQRSRLNKDIYVKLSHENTIKFVILDPKIEFTGEFTSLGKKLEKHEQGVSGLTDKDKLKSMIEGKLVYLRLDEEITKDKCKGNIVMIDTYGKYKPRIAQIRRKGAFAVILALHSDNAKTEGLEVKADDEDTKQNTGQQDITQIAASSVMRSGFGNNNNASQWAQFGSLAGGGDRQRLQSFVGGPPSAMLGLSSVGVEQKSESKDESKDENKAGVDESETNEDESKLEDEEVIKRIIIMAIPKNTCEIIRSMMGVKSGNDPIKIHHRMMIDELIKKGHKKKLAERALKKNEQMTIESADAWIKQNIEWLDQSLDTDLQPRAVILKKELKNKKSLDELLNIGQIIDDEKTIKNTYDLAQKWNMFEESGLKDLDVTPSQLRGRSIKTIDESNSVPMVAGPKWYNDIYYRPLHALLLSFVYNEHALRVHNIRRALLNIFMNINIGMNDDITLEEFELERMLHVCLSYSPFPANEINPMDSLVPINITGRLVRCLREDKSSIYLNTLLRSSQSSFRNVCRGALIDSIDEEQKECRKFLAPVHARFGQASSSDKTLRVNEFTWKKARRLKIIVSADATLSSLGTGYFTMYKEKEMNTIIARFVLNAFDNNKHVKIIDSDTFYYTVLSSSYYHGSASASIIVNVLDLSDNYRILESDVLRGTLYSSMIFVNSLLKSKITNIDLLLLQILRCLEFVPKRREATALIRLATNIFRDWNTLKHSDNDDNKKLLTEIAVCLDKLEDAHASLRTTTLRQWSSGKLPGAHIQSLLELLLTARVIIKRKTSDDDETEAVPESTTTTATTTPAAKTNETTETKTGDTTTTTETKTGDEVKDEVKDDVKPAVKKAEATPPFNKAPEIKSEAKADVDEAKKEVEVTDEQKEWFTKFRDGPSSVTVISLMYEEIQKTRTLQTKRDQHNRYMIDDFVGDVCVRNGGKWYFEVKFMGSCGYTCVGWIKRKYRKTSNSGISNDYNGQSWCVYGPNTYYYHRGSSIRPDVINPNYVRPNWSGGVVVGAKLDLDNGKMEFTFDGEPAGVCFQGFDSSEGLYPCISLNQATQCVVNFGNEPFVHLPKDDDYIGYENKFIKTSSWLKRYKVASDVSTLLTNRLPFGDKLINDCLKDEASLDSSHKMSFEIVKSNATTVISTMDKILHDDGGNWGTFIQDTNIVLKIKGYEPSEFVLRSMNIRCSSSTNGFHGMIFISQTEPDFDQFEWCKHFTQEQFDSFEKRRGNNKIRRPHEPVGFFKTDNYSINLKLKNIARGKFLTVKIISPIGATNLYIEYIKLDCIHGSHPLSSLVGNKDELNKKRTEIISTLTTNIVNDNNNKVWNLTMDEILTEMSQIIADRIGVGISSLDCVMLKPTENDLSRFKKLKHLSTDAMQSRFSIIKYLNKLVTPLLHFIDISLFQDNSDENILFSNFSSLQYLNDEDLLNEREQYSFKNLNKNVDNRVLSDNNVSLSKKIQFLKGCYFMTTKKSVFDTLLAGSGVSSTSSSSKPRITINRIKAAKAKEDTASDPYGLKSVFGQLYTQLKEKNIRYTTLRGKPGQQMWVTVFSGEGYVFI